MPHPLDSWRPSRKQALEEGRLIQADPQLAHEAGLRHPVALTVAAWDDCVAWTNADAGVVGVGQDETGRLWDVLSMAARAIRRLARRPHRPTSHLTYPLVRVPRNLPRGTMARIEDNELDFEQVCGTLLTATVHPDDDGEPVLTITLPGEPVPGISQPGTRAPAASSGGPPVPPPVDTDDTAPVDQAPDFCWRCDAQPGDPGLLGLCLACHRTLTASGLAAPDDT